MVAVIDRFQVIAGSLNENAPELPTELARVFLEIEPDRAMRLPPEIYNSPSMVSALVKGLQQALRTPDDVKRTATLQKIAQIADKIGPAAVKQAKYTDVLALSYVSAANVLIAVMDTAFLTGDTLRVVNATDAATLPMRWQNSLAAYLRIAPGSNQTPTTPIVEVKPGAGTGFFAGTAGRGGIPVNVRCR